MRKWWLLLAGLAGWVVLGCLALGPASPDAPADQPTAVPGRIVSMAPDLTETLYAMGLQDRIAAITSDSDYPPAAAGKPRVGTFWQPNIEAVIAVKPDLVMTEAFEQHRHLVQRLRRMGYRCLSFNIERMDDLFAAMESIGTAAGQSAEAADLIAALRGRMERVRSIVAGRDRPRVLWVVQREPLRVAGLDTFVNGIIDWAGGRNALGPTLHKYPPIGAEQVIASNVQAIVEPMMTSSDAETQRRAAIAYWNRFTNVPAVAGKRIYVIDGDIVSRLSPRMVDGIEAVAQCLHPEAFAR
jgi:iron complex transport system substrate-binding protein